MDPLKNNLTLSPPVFGLPAPIQPSILQTLFERI